jgi:prophage regulatory protein
MPSVAQELYCATVLHAITPAYRRRQVAHMSRNGAKTDFVIIGSAELMRRIPFSGVHIWRLERQGRFPKRIKLGSHRVGWALDEVVAWIEARKSLRGK